MMIILKERTIVQIDTLGQFLYLSKGGEEKETEISKVLNRQAYFYLEVWSLFDLLGLLLRWPLDLVLLLVSLQPPQLLLNTSTLLPHFFSVLLIEEGKLPSADTNIHNIQCDDSMQLVNWQCLSPSLNFKHISGTENDISMT